MSKFLWTQKTKALFGSFFFSKSILSKAVHYTVFLGLLRLLNMAILKYVFFAYETSHFSTFLFHARKH